MNNGFNPRTHTGCDVENNLLPDCIWVSIHAPTRGATRTTKPMEYRPMVSIHAPTRGATLTSTANRVGKTRFNPRTHTGCDSSGEAGEVRGSRFQSTHPHGVRHYTCLLVHFPTEFQSTHPHGVRQTRFLGRDTDISFNPRTHTGCDLYIISSCLSA